MANTGGKNPLSIVFCFWQDKREMTGVMFCWFELVKQILNIVVARWDSVTELCSITPLGSLLSFQRLSRKYFSEILLDC